MSFFLDNKTLIEGLNKTFEELSAPLGDSIRTVWRGAGAPDGKSVLQNQLALTAQQFINIREGTAAEKQRYYEEVCRHFQLSCAKNTFPLAEPTGFTPSLQKKLDRTPVVVSYLETHDARQGTKHADLARHALFQFANLVVKSDGQVTLSEEAELFKFKESLYPPNTLASAANVAASAQAAAAVEDAPARPLQELQAELDALVGLERVKADVRQLVNFLKVQRMREERKMKPLPLSRHLVFYGNPGTGKTTVARLLAQIYRSLKILSRGHLTETDRAGMVAGFVGQTAIKVKEVVANSLGGVLFIDEAYSLAAGGENDFGREAVETLLKLMEDHRDDLIVVVAGYTGRMKEFLDSNPGLRSRFNKHLHFDDYDERQLLEIFRVFARKAEFKLTSAAEETLTALFTRLVSARDETFGNARTVRNLFESAISKQANRVVSLAEVNEDVLSTIEAEDIPTPEELVTLGVAHIAPTGEEV